ncbi:MAG: hypothetical protein KGL93_03800, partial [Gemmatimonadota bacterium]|nr:hypothetical protein [Gemmatimonadota bacterium]
ALANTQIKISGCEPPKVTPTITGTMGNDGWYTSNVQVSWDVQSDAALTSETGCDAVTLGTDTDGITYTCTASSDEGTTTKSVTVKRDATPPAIAFSGNAGTYGVSQVVNIACSASDATSGLASSTCPEVSDSAYTLALGGHTLSATATDHAGNAGSASATFQVTVSLQDLIALSQAWVAGPGAAGVANSLAAKLTGSHPNVQAFINEVKAQSGKKIPADKAALLIQFASTLL